MVTRVHRAKANDNERCRSWELAAKMAAMGAGGKLATGSAIETALDGVAPRLRKVREQRGATLTDVAARTGISKSTLSRLENGQRKPSLELLLPLAELYRVPLDDLVGAPESG